MVKSLTLLWLAGLCLRMTVLAIPPVIPLMHQSFTMTQATVGALASLPVLLFSFAAIPGSLLVARLGAARVLVAGILATAVFGALRGAAPDVAMVMAATLAMAAGISIMQPALPSVVREWVPERIALGTAVYSNGLLVGEAISASLTIPAMLPLVEGNWRWSLVGWSVPVIAIGAIVWVMRPRTAADHGHRHGGLPRRWWPDWRDPLTWKLGFLSGYASSLYFANNAFLPDYLAARGRPDLLNPTLSALNWLQIPASILMLLFARHLAMRRWPFVSLQVLSIVALAGLLGMDDAWIVPWAGVIGFCNAFLLILTLALPPLISEPDDVHRLSAAMIFIGYLIAFVMPIVGGFLWDVSHSPPVAFAPLFLYALLAVGMAATLRFPHPHRHGA
jgi:CP family cyanate transporter-like MFS transporter